MKKNIGKIDSFIRILLAITLFLLMDGQSKNIQIIMGVLAGVLLFTAFSGFCLLYRLFGINTRQSN